MADHGGRSAGVCAQVAGQFLGDIWLTAWQTAPEDGYLKTQLLKRNAKGAMEAKPGE